MWNANLSSVIASEFPSSPFSYRTEFIVESHRPLSIGHKNSIDLCLQLNLSSCTLINLV